jgi:hypothetical protein
MNGAAMFTNSGIQQIPADAFFYSADPQLHHALSSKGTFRWNVS